jgi:membrane protease subunit HflK|tara:strand:+ start:3241 stop:4389 length:1149 start_codon:yes stop_codon:yes gene_type:complete
MAWNEPGDNKGNRDPWNNQGGNQGPPDLDEFARKLQNSLKGLFGGSGGSSGGQQFSLSRGVLGLVFLVVAIIYLLAGVYTVDQQELGVELRLGKLKDEIIEPGLSHYWPLIEEMRLVNVTNVRSRSHEAEMLTEDENIVKVKLSIQYVIGNPAQFWLRVKDPDESLDQATQSALRHVVGGSEMHDVLTEGRAEVQVLVKERVQRYMDVYGTGIVVTQVNIDETAPPDEVKAAFDDVIKAREDEVRVKNEADAYANQIIPEARGEAQRQLEEAEAYKQRVISEASGEAQRFSKLLTEYKLAPEVTRERLYLDAIESVMANSTKVMIDTKGGNNLLYLPLDKLVQQSESIGGPGVGTSDLSNLADRVERLLRQRQTTAPRRERR